MKILSVLGLGLLGVLVASPAFALTITNEEHSPQTVIVTEGGNSKTITIDSQKSVSPACDKGCIVELKDSGDQYEMQGPEKVSIDQDVIFVDADPPEEKAAEQQPASPPPAASADAQTGSSDSTASSGDGAAAGQ